MLTFFFCRHLVAATLFRSLTSSCLFESLRDRRVPLLLLVLLVLLVGFGALLLALGLLALILVLISLLILVFVLVEVSGFELAPSSEMEATEAMEVLLGESSGFKDDAPCTGDMMNWAV